MLRQRAGAARRRACAASGRPQLGRAWPSRAFRTAFRRPAALAPGRSPPSAAADRSWRGGGGSPAARPACWQIAAISSLLAAAMGRGNSEAISSVLATVGSCSNCGFAAQQLVARVAQRHGEPDAVVQPREELPLDVGAFQVPRLQVEQVVVVPQQSRCRPRRPACHASVTSHRQPRPAERETENQRPAGRFAAGAAMRPAAIDEQNQRRQDDDRGQSTHSRMPPPATRPSSRTPTKSVMRRHEERRGRRDAAGHHAGPDFDRHAQAAPTLRRSPCRRSLR